MKKGWNITEKIICTILQGWALYYLYAITYEVYASGQKSLQMGLITHDNMKYGDLFRTMHIYYFMGLMCLYGGLALLYDRKGGWVASVTTTALFTGFLLVSGRNGIIKDNSAQIMASVGYLIAAFVFASMFIILLLKPFRAKYKPTIYNWLVITGIIVLVLLDRNVLMPMLKK